MRHSACRCAFLRCRNAQPYLNNSLRNLRLFLRKPCGLVLQTGTSLRRLLTPSSLPYASNRFSAVHDRHQTAPPCLQQKREPAQPERTVHHGVPGWPSQLPAGSIQSPYFHRASGLAQIAVSTMLRTTGIGKRKFLHAEHCGYGTRDLPLVQMRDE